MEAYNVLTNRQGILVLLEMYENLCENYSATVGNCGVLLGLTQLELPVCSSSGGAGSGTGQRVEGDDAKAVGALREADLAPRSTVVTLARTAQCSCEGPAEASPCISRCTSSELVTPPVNHRLGCVSWSEN